MENLSLSFDLYYIAFQRNKSLNFFFPFEKECQKKRLEMPGGTLRLAKTNELDKYVGQFKTQLII